jgi:hypothetical protein
MDGGTGFQPVQYCTGETPVPPYIAVLKNNFAFVAAGFSLRREKFS